MLSLPFVHLNLRYNPFGELEPQARASLAVVGLLRAADGEVLRIIGEAGRGKTTHLLALGRARPGSIYEHVPEGESRYRAKQFPAEGYPS